jgi:ABC-type lipoprotein release transport system permease subunit
VPTAKCAKALGQIIKCSKKIWGNAIFTIILIAAFGTKNVHSALRYSKVFGVALFFTILEHCVTTYPIYKSGTW